VTAAVEARTRILDAAEHVFAERGFDGAATSLIATTAGVPKGLLFYYFPTKKDLLSCLVGERLGIGAIDAGPLIQPGNPVRSLLNLSEKLFQVLAASGVLRVILWREEHTHPVVKANLAAHRRGLQASIEQVLNGSLRVPVAAERVRAAALAWAAILTTHPLTNAPAGPERQTHSSHADLGLLAEMLCAGLLHGESVPLGRIRTSPGREQPGGT
jgi:AcrR family transcriptional regulator